MPMNPSTISPRRKRVSRYLGLGWVLAGACFLFDPFISIFDLLPDALGYLFVAIGLRLIADLDDRLADVAKGARRLALLGVARVLALFLAFGFVSASEQPMFILVALFSLGVLDVILLIPFWKNLCGGLLYLGTRHDAVTMFDRRKRGEKEHRRSITERYTAFSLVWFIVREALAVLPEMTVLTHEKGGVELGEGTVFYDFVGLFRGLAGAIGLVIGVAWLVCTVLYVRKLFADRPFMEALRNRYITEVLPRDDLFAMRAVKACLTCLGVSAVFAIDFYLDGVNILPDFLSAVMLFLAILFIRPYVGRSLRAVAAPLIATAVYGIAALWTWLRQFGDLTIDTTLEAAEGGALYDQWIAMLLYIGITGFLFFISLFLVLRPLWRLIRQNTGFQTLNENSTYAEERTRAIHRQLKIKLNLILIFAYITALSTLWHWGGIPILAAMPIDPETPAALILLKEFFTEAYWMVDIFLGVAFVCVTFHTTYAVSDRMEYTYIMK